MHKWLHYLPIYESLSDRWVGKPVRFFEIGVFQGGSLRLWRDYFGPDAMLTGIDINPACRQYNGLAGQVRIGSQADPKFLISVVEEMGGLDVLLDDGSHIGQHQQVSFETLFPLLSEGGLYVIEDLHTSCWGAWGGGFRRPGTGIEFLKSCVDAMHGHYQNDRLNTSAAIPEIESIQFFDSIAVITKKTSTATQARYGAAAGAASFRLIKNALPAHKRPTHSRASSRSASDGQTPFLSGPLRSSRAAAR